MSVLVVQMGHAGRTSGATGAPGEQAYTQAVGAECARLLSGVGGWAVHLILADPPSSAYYRGDAFVAVHADGSTDPSVRGASVGYQTSEGGGLAHAWREDYVALGFSGPWHPDNYTVNLAQYYGVRAAVAIGNRRACIIECGTITNAEDRALMDPTRVALAIGAALGITQLAPPEPPPVPIPEEIDAMQDGSLFYAKGDRASAVYVVRVDHATGLTRRYVEGAELEVVIQAGGEKVAVLNQASFDAIPKVEGSP